MTGPEVLFAKAALWLLGALGTLAAVMAGVGRWATGHAPKATRQDATSEPSTPPMSGGKCPWCRHQHQLLSRCGRMVPIEGGAGLVGCSCDGTAPPEEVEVDTRNRAHDMSPGVDIDRISNRASKARKDMA